MNQRRPKREAEPPFLGTFRQAEIAEMTARVAAGSMDFVIGSGLIRFEDGAMLFLQGVGTQATFQGTGSGSGTGTGPGTGNVGSAASFLTLGGAPNDNILLAAVLAGKASTASVNLALQNTVSTGMLQEALQSLVTTTALNQALQSRVTTTAFNAALADKQAKLPATTADGTKVLYDDLQWRVPPTSTGNTTAPAPSNSEPVASASQMTVPSRSGENGEPTRAVRLLSKTPSILEYGAVATDDSDGVPLNSPISSRYSTLSAARQVYPFLQVDSDLDSQLDWAALQAVAYDAADGLTSFDADGLNLNLGGRAVFWPGRNVKLITKNCRIYTGGFTTQVITDGSAPLADTSFPRTEAVNGTADGSETQVDMLNLGPLAGAAFVFPEATEAPVIQGVTFDGLRFPIVFMRPVTNLRLRDVHAHRCNAMVLAYEGCTNLMLEHCGENVDLGTLLISSATAYPAGHPQEGTADSATYGLTALNTDFVPLLYTDFNTWFRDSILRPTVQSITSSGSATYAGSDLNATGRKVYVPLRNAQTPALTFSAISGGTVTTNSLVQLAANAPIAWGQASTTTPSPAPPAPAPSPTPAPPPASTSTTFLYLDFQEAVRNQRPATWQNKASGGDVYYNRGANGNLGGKGFEYGPYPDLISCFTDSAESGNRMAIVSAAAESFTGVFSLENHFRIGNGDGTVFSISETGLNSGNTHLSVFANETGVEGKRTFTFYAKALGITNSVTTPLIDEMILNGEKCYHVVIGRNSANKLYLKSQGNFIMELPDAFAGTIQGFVCPWGVYRQDGTVDSLFSASLGFARGARAELYPGATYVVPTTTPALT